MSGVPKSRLSKFKPRLRAPSLYGVITAVVVGASSLLVLSQLHPDLLIMNSTTAGGDMGAHVWTPRYLVDHLLPHFRFTGWSPDWYAGFPALHFYFPLPTVLIALLDVVLPGAVAFKLVSVSGLIALPICTYAFGRLANLPFPVPACLAAFTVPFLFLEGYSILGGNIKSTLAGEFSFTIALSLAMLLLGVVARGVRTGRHRVLASLLFAAVILSHILPTIFAFVAGLLIILIAMASNSGQGRRAVLAPLLWAVPVGAIGGLLSAWWLAPFVLRSNYMNDMGWEKIGTGAEAGMKLFGEPIIVYSDALFPGPIMPVAVVAFASAALALYFRRPVGILIFLIAIISAAAFVLMPQGRLWNARLLPFWYFSLFLLAGLLIGEIGRGISETVARLKDSEFIKDVADGLRITAPLVALVIAGALVIPTLPEPTWWKGPAIWYDANSSKTRSEVQGWAEWNYSGYDGKKKDGTYYKPAHPEFLSVIDMLRTAGHTNGCGRVMWEYEGKALDRFGTPMALMLSPLYTKGCMGSMEGLYFESSATVPYHFLNQRELSAQPSSAMREIPYAPGIDVSSGVDKLQVLGVKYYMALTAEAQQQAAVEPRLSLVSSTPASPSELGEQRTWNLYEVAGSEIVAPLKALPNVLANPDSIPTSRDGKLHKKHSPREAWLENALAWYGNPNNFDTPLADDGPKNWPRIENALQPVIEVPVEPSVVTYTGMGDDRISFRVEKPGTPVLVKTSYFPNWKAKGAHGPYRVTPNSMVVIPTSNDVTIHYGRTLVDIGAVALTLLAIPALLWMRRLDRRGKPESERELVAAEPAPTGP